jgi:quercetin dioxygenase-like cupin family protein
MMPAIIFSLAPSLYYPMLKAYKLYTGEDGHSHIKTGTVNEGMLNQASTVRFQESPPHSFYDWHNAPTCQYVINLLGTLEFETFPGETFILNPGEILVAMDTTGTAHRWKMKGEDPWRRVYIAFDESLPVNFVEDKE